MHLVLKHWLENIENIACLSQYHFATLAKTKIKDWYSCMGNKENKELKIPSLHIARCARGLK
jgi:hypothetical protein